MAWPKFFWPVPVWLKGQEVLVCVEGDRWLPGVVRQRVFLKGPKTVVHDWGYRTYHSVYEVAYTDGEEERVDLFFSDALRSPLDAEGDPIVTPLPSRYRPTPSPPPARC